MLDAASGALLTLGSNDVIESILSDIPLFCVGLTSFGVFTFFLVMKRVNRLAIYLYSSSILALVAAILDLSQSISRARVNTSFNTRIEPVSGLIIVREICLAFFVGFIYLFMWNLVAQCPPGERRASALEARVHNEKKGDVHSASWHRWGLFGLLLKWFLLGSSLSIPILQIVWRLVTTQNGYGSVYVAESTFEIVVSALFILKLLLNILISPVTSWWHPFRFYAATFVALLFSVGIGVGNLAYFAFSETTLGRSLRAVELYILILFILITTFHPTPSQALEQDVSALPHIGRKFSLAVHLDKSTGAGNHSDSPVSKSPNVMLIGPSFISFDETQRHSRASTASRLSSLILSHGFTASSDNRGSRGSNDAERGIVPPHLETPFTAGSGGLNPTVEKQDQYSSSPSAFSPSVNFADALTNQRPLTEISFSSYYKMEQDIRMSHLGDAQGTLRPRSNSPIYGLDGIIDRSQNRISMYTGTRHSSQTSFDAILRQQSELDQSIAALRLFSPQAITIPPREANSNLDESSLSPSLSNRTNSISIISYTGIKPDSASARSEFSLSIFPEPPVANAKLQMTSSNIPLTKRTRQRSRIRRDITAFGTLSFQRPHKERRTPLSESQSQSGILERFDSVGTQYDVTSFIGGLNDPINEQVRQSASPNGNLDVQPEDNPATTTSRQVIRPMILSSITSFLDFTPTTTQPTGSETQSPVHEIPVLRPLLLGTSAAVPHLLPSSTMVPIGSRRPRAGGLPVSPRLGLVTAYGPPQDGKESNGSQAIL